MRGRPFCHVDAGTNCGGTAALPSILPHMAKRLEPIFVKLNDVRPGGNGRERQDRHAAFGSNV